MARAWPEPAFAPQNFTAVELMASVLRESQEPVTLVATGPQTNVALLLASHPELHAKIARIVIMGGAMGLGNWQPAAEFNIYVDPPGRGNGLSVRDPGGDGGP